MGLSRSTHVRLTGSPRRAWPTCVDTEVLTAEHAAAVSKWYFDKKDHRLLGAEVNPVRDEDPCELYFHDFKAVDGRLLPHRIEIRYGNGRFGVLTIRKYQLAQA